MHREGRWAGAPPHQYPRAPLNRISVRPPFSNVRGTSFGKLRHRVYSSSSVWSGRSCTTRRPGDHRGLRWGTGGVVIQNGGCRIRTRSVEGFRQFFFVSSVRIQPKKNRAGGEHLP